MIYLIRHLEKEPIDKDVRTDDYAARTKTVTLSQEGIARSNRVARYIKEEMNVKSIYVSDYVRTEMTADIVSRYVAVPVNLDSRLVERTLCTGAFSQDTIHDYNERSLMDWGWSAPGGESMNDVANRMHQCISSLKLADDEDVLIVSHSRSIQAYLGNFHSTYSPAFHSSQMDFRVPYGMVIPLQGPPITVN